MGKYNFRIVGSSFIKELDVEVGQSPRLESFKQPSFELSVDKIIMNESGVYKTAMYFNQIGTIDSIVPVDIEDAYEKLLLLIVNFNLGGATPQIESYSLTEIQTNGIWIDGKPIYRKVIPISYNPENGFFSINHNLSIDRYLKTEFLLAVETYESDTAPATIGFPNLILINPSTNFLFVESDYYNADYIILEYTKTTD
jgi:hypothetical protein